MQKINRTGQVLIKHLLAKEGRLTTQQLTENYLPKYKLLKSKSHVKHCILNDLWKRGQVIKKMDPEIVNSVTKKGTFFWYLDPELDKIYKEAKFDTEADLELEPETLLPNQDLIPLLGRTGPYSHFKKEGFFEILKVQTE